MPSLACSALSISISPLFTVSSIDFVSYADTYRFYYIWYEGTLDDPPSLVLLELDCLCAEAWVVGCGLAELVVITASSSSSSLKSWSSSFLIKWPELNSSSLNS